MAWLGAHDNNAYRYTGTLTANTSSVTRAVAYPITFANFRTISAGLTYIAKDQDFANSRREEDSDFKSRRGADRTVSSTFSIFTFKPFLVGVFTVNGYLVGRAASFLRLVDLRVASADFTLIRFIR